MIALLYRLSTDVFCNIFSVGVCWLPWFYFRGVPSIHLRNLMPVIRSTAIWMMSKAKIIIAGMIISGLLVRERDRLRLVRDFYQNR